jgi:hypothetical protein
VSSSRAGSKTKPSLGDFIFQISKLINVAPQRHTPWTIPEMSMPMVMQKLEHLHAGNGILPSQSFVSNGTGGSSCAKNGNPPLQGVLVFHSKQDMS